MLAPSSQSHRQTRFEPASAALMRSIADSHELLSDSSASRRVRISVVRLTRVSIGRVVNR